MADQADSKWEIPVIYNRIFLTALCVLPFLAVSFPRFLGYAPAIFGLAGWIFYRFLTGRWPELFRPVFILSGATVILAGLSTFWAVDSSFALERTGKMLLIVFGGSLLFSLVKNLSQDFVKDFNRVFPWAVIFAGLFCCFELYGGGVIYQTLRPAVEKTHNFSVLNRGVVVFTLCFFVAIGAVNYSENSERYKRNLLWVLLAVLLAVSFKTQSQSAQLAILAGGLLYFFFPYRLKGAWGALAVFLSACFLAAPWIARFLFDHLAPVVDGLPWFRQSYAADRMEIWDFISRRALENPLYGFGIEATREITDFNTARIYYPDAYILHPHNFAIQLWIEFGVLGAVFASAFFSYLLFRLQKLPVEVSRYGLPVLLACISVATTGYGLWQSWWLGTFFLVASFYMLVVRGAR